MGQLPALFAVHRRVLLPGSWPRLTASPLRSLASEGLLMPKQGKQPGGALHEPSFFSCYEIQNSMRNGAFAPASCSLAAFGFSALTCYTPVGPALVDGEGGDAQYRTLFALWLISYDEEHVKTMGGAGGGAIH